MIAWKPAFLQVGDKGIISFRRVFMRVGPLVSKGSVGRNHNDSSYKNLEKLLPIPLQLSKLLCLKALIQL